MSLECVTSSEPLHIKPYTRNQEFGTSAVKCFTEGGTVPKHTECHLPFVYQGVHPSTLVPTPRTLHPAPYTLHPKTPKP